MKYILYIVSISILATGLVTSIVQYDEYIAGHFPLHLVVFVVVPIAIFATIAHAYEEITGNKNTWYRRLIRKMFGL